MGSISSSKGGDVVVTVGLGFLVFVGLGVGVLRVGVGVGVGLAEVGTGVVGAAVLGATEVGVADGDVVIVGVADGVGSSLELLRAAHSAPAPNPSRMATTTAITIGARDGFWFPGSGSGAPAGGSCVVG